MKTFCQFCGSEIELFEPIEVDHKHEEIEADYTTRSKWIIYNKDGYIVGEWIAKDAINSYHAICDCGKRIFHVVEEEKQQKTIVAFRSIIETKQQVNVVLSKFNTFVLGEHWYPFTKLNDENTQLIFEF